MKWTEGLRRIWIIWCWIVGGVTAMLLVAAQSGIDSPDNFGDFIALIVTLVLFAGFFAYLPRFPWLFMDLVKWVRDGFKEPPSK